MTATVVMTSAALFKKRKEVARVEAFFSWRRGNSAFQHLTSSANDCSTKTRNIRALKIDRRFSSERKNKNDNNKEERQSAAKFILFKEGFSFPQSF